MKSARAFAPANISLLFKVMPSDDPSKAGSLGSGFTADKGATVEVRESSQLEITYNQEPLTLPPLVEVIKMMTDKPLHVDIDSPLPLGSGFGMSGASSLAASYAINKLYSLEKTERELVQLAHTAEVIHKTGLGDVGNQQYGGCCVKFVTSALFEMHRLPFTGTQVHVASWGKIPTPSILANTPLMQSLDKAGDQALGKIKERMFEESFSFEDLLEISNIFTKTTGLIEYAPHAKQTIHEIQKHGGKAAMIILGDAVVSTIPFEGSMPLTISEQGVRLLKD
jgi:pantoate kinase